MLVSPRFDCRQGQDCIILSVLYYLENTTTMRYILTVAILLFSLQTLYGQEADIKYDGSKLRQNILLPMEATALGKYIAFEQSLVNIEIRTSDKNRVVAVVCPPNSNNGAIDSAVGLIIEAPVHLGSSSDFSEPVNAYWARLQARDGFQRAKAAQVKAAAEQGVAGELRI